jgi:hypothetical protein
MNLIYFQEALLLPLLKVSILEIYFECAREGFNLNKSIP